MEMGYAIFSENGEGGTDNVFEKPTRLDKEHENKTWVKNVRNELKTNINIQEYLQIRIT